ncbi:hypothetical protein T484DRAFT_3449529 [Baffinella frigidus]|nr:hypothetical protein T484DRAFT_3449529 [Cryptophyta sp. CCMP2293]
MRQVLQAKATDKSKLVLDQRERTQRLRLATASTTSSRPSRFSPASDADGNTAGGGQSRPLSSSRRPTSAAARAAAPELVARFTSTVNMVGMHMQRAEVERAVSQDMIETQYNVAQKREAKSLAVEATRRHKLERQTQSSHSHQVEKEALRAFLDDTRGKPAVRNIRIQRRHNTPLTPAGRDSRGSGGQLSTGRVVDTDDERSTTSVARGWKGGDSPATPFEVRTPNALCLVPSDPYGEVLIRGNPFFYHLIPMKITTRMIQYLLVRTNCVVIFIAIK